MLFVKFETLDYDDYDESGISGDYISRDVITYVPYTGQNLAWEMSKTESTDFHNRVIVSIVEYDGRKETGKALVVADSGRKTN